MAGPNVQTAIVTSDTLVRTGHTRVYWVAVSAGATGGAFQLNDSTDDSGTDRFDFTVPATSATTMLDFSNAPIDFLTGLFVDVPGTNLTVNVGYTA